eukprot:3842765-Prymnesium_polylepis.1
MHKARKNKARRGTLTRPACGAQMFGVRSSPARTKSARSMCAYARWNLDCSPACPRAGWPAAVADGLGGWGGAACAGSGRAVSSEVGRRVGRREIPAGAGSHA